MDTHALREEHAMLLRSASRLAGLATTIKTRGDAISARAVIEGMNAGLVAHLTTEDTELYPEMMASENQALQAMAREAFADMGVIHGAWTAYRNVWTVDRILLDPTTFDAATRGLVEALAMRIAMENEVLYPAAESAHVLARVSKSL